MVFSPQIQGYINKYGKLITTRKLCTNLLSTFIQQHEQTGGIADLDEADLVLFDVSRKVANLYLKKIASQSHPEISELSSQLEELLELLNNFEQAKNGDKK